MFRKSSFVLIAFILVSSGPANGKLQNASSNSALSDKAPQSMEQTFNINNWGLGKVDRKLLTEMKYKIDSLYEKYGKGKLVVLRNFKFICFNMWCLFWDENLDLLAWICALL